MVIHLYLLSFTLLFSHPNPNPPQERVLVYQGLNTSGYVAAENSTLFSGPAMARAAAILDSLKQKDAARDYTLVFGVTHLPLLSIEDEAGGLEGPQIRDWLAGFSPPEKVRGAVDAVKGGYNQALLNKCLSDHPSQQDRTILLYNVFVYPYKSGVLTHTYAGYVPSGTIPTLPGTPCGELSPLQPVGENDAYLTAVANTLAAPWNFYTPQGVNDRLAALTPGQLDTIGLTVDTVQDERTWHVRVDIIAQGCPSVAGVAMNQAQAVRRVQLIIEVAPSQDSGDPSYSVHLSVSQDIRRFLPQRFLNYIRDSIALPELRNNGLYPGVIRAVERFRRPLPGDPLFEMRAVHNNSAPTSGGLFGCARVGTGCTSSIIPNLPQYGTFQKVHNGIDVYAALDTDIFAMYDGTVERVVNTVPPNTEGNQGDFGNRVRLRHTWQQYGGQQGAADIYSYYTHLNAVETLTVGNPVTQGQKIGETGKTGNAAGIPEWRYHSHINIYAGGVAASDVVNPIPYFFTQLNNN